MNSRVEYIDVARGIGILLVVIGHNPYVTQQSSLPFSIIYSFHIPLFLFLSGIFFSANNPFTKIVKTRFFSLLVPYVLAIVGSAVFKKVTGSSQSLSDMLFGGLYGTAATVTWVPLWYLPHIFTVSVFSWGVIRLYQRFSMMVQLGFQAACLVVGFILLKLLLDWFPGVFPKGLPWSVDLLLISSFYFILGYTVKLRGMDILHRSRWLALVSMFIFVGLHVCCSYRLDLSQRIYDNLVVNTLLSCSGIVITVFLSRVIEQRLTLLRRLFSYIGKLSLTILIFHGYLQLKAYGDFVQLFPRGANYGLHVFMSIGGAVIGSIIIHETYNRVVLRVLRQIQPS